MWRPRCTPLATFLTLLALLASLSSCKSAEQRSLEENLEAIRDVTFIPKLGSYDEEEQRDAIQKVMMGLDRAPDIVSNILAASLKDESYDERTHLVIARLLADKKDVRAVPTLVKHVGSPHEQAQSIVRDALLEYGSSIVDHVAEVLETGDATSRLAAAEILFELRLAEGYDALYDRESREPVPEVRFLILCGTAEDPRPLAVGRLYRFLMDGDELVRSAAWSAIQEREPTPEVLGYDPDGKPDERRKQVARLQQWRENRGDR